MPETSFPTCGSTQLRACLLLKLRDGGMFMASTRSMSRSRSHYGRSTSISSTTLSYSYFWLRLSSAFLCGNSTMQVKHFNSTQISYHISLDTAKEDYHSCVVRMDIQMALIEILFKNGPFSASFSFIFVFSVQLTLNYCSI